MNIEIRDPGLHEILDEDLTLEQLSSDFQFTEGPIWHPGEQHLTFCDIRANRLFRWSEAEGLSLFREPSNMANGNTYDRQGRMLSCEHATSRVTRTEQNGTVKVLASHYQGKELNSPNDIIVRKDGSVWFTDPTYGRQGHTGIIREPELNFQGVFSVDPESRELRLLADDFETPNGLAFNLDHTGLYVADTVRMHIRYFDITPDGSITGGEVFARSTGEGAGAPDGLKIDSQGNVFCAGPGGIHIYRPDDGQCLGVIKTPAFCANFAWGGDDLCSLFLTSSTQLLRTRVKVPGIQLFQI
jgi:gluconolactonase